MRLIIISPPEDNPDEPEVVCWVLHQSSATVYLRKPGQTDRQIADYLKQVPVSYHPRIMVHGHPRLLDHFDLMGIHFTEKERTHNLQRLRQLRLAQPGCRLSSAFHRITDIPEYDGLFDYILLSPIFDSISKPGYRSAFDHSDLRPFLSWTEHTVIALGGLDAQRAVTAASLGFKGIAVLGAVWQAVPPEKAARQLSAVCRAIETHPVHGAPNT
ncbi:thiamine phosphate synthase [Desulfosarcina sp.]|nr:thiamine phosphate synthase [Desulfosarcina sp.]